jgi:hypothetical protein
MNNRSDNKLNQLVASARVASETREQGYRHKALTMYPHICGRCAREFDKKNLFELTVHHRNHNHDDNPEDGSNWELLCVYCHDNEHQRNLDTSRYNGADKEAHRKEATSNPFADLKSLLKKKSE